MTPIAVTGAGIVLIDEDRTAMECSKRPVGNLEKLDILETDALTVHHENAGNLLAIALPDVVITTEAYQRTSGSKKAFRSRLQLH